MTKSYLKIIVSIVLCILTGCSNDNFRSPNTPLSTYLKSAPNKKGEVIACAASSKDLKNILIYFFPEKNTSNYNLYLSNSLLQKNDFSTYQKAGLSSKISVANTLRAFTLNKEQSEVWAVVTFEISNEIHYSNPIRLKQQKSPTLYNNKIEIDTKQLSFNWENTLGQDGTKNAIFFRIVAHANNHLISGTYSTATTYTYLDKTNETLSITPNNNTPLINGLSYRFSVMGVSTDNWVNFISEKTFISQQ